VALKPVRARLVERAEDWRSSSGAAHLPGGDEDLVSVALLPNRCAGRSRIPISIGTEPSAEALSALRAAETIGCPLGSSVFRNRLAALSPRSASVRNGMTAENERIAATIDWR
jgi:putative transposase